MDRAVDRVMDFDGWIPVRVYAGATGYRVDWCYFGERRLTEPFFRSSVQLMLQEPFNLAFRQDTTIDAMLEWADTRPGIAPTAFIFHTSRCGSTLLSRMLMALQTHVVVSEPTVLDVVLRARYKMPELSRELQLAWIRATVSALAQPRAGGESRFVAKLDAWNITELALMRDAFPGVPWIFLYREPLEVAASQLKMPGAFMVPGMMGPSPALMSADEAIAMPRSEFVAEVLGRIFEAGAAGCRAFGGRPVNYRELPDALWGPLAEDFGVVPDESTIALLRDAARLDAKNPHFEFVADSAQKRADASAELRAAVDRRIAPAYASLEALARGTVARRDPTGDATSSAGSHPAAANASVLH
jgi:hypothetical protein